MRVSLSANYPAVAATMNAAMDAAMAGVHGDHPAKNDVDGSPAMALRRNLVYQPVPADPCQVHRADRSLPGRLPPDVARTATSQCRSALEGLRQGGGSLSVEPGRSSDGGFPSGFQQHLCHLAHAGLPIPAVRPPGRPSSGSPERPGGIDRLGA